ncbi:MAG TPA: hypothetical protein VF814_04425 [Casimicrobiaceae bacterium]
MKIQTLISNQRYFGLEPLIFRQGATRTLARVAGLPLEHARVSAQSLREDFRLDSAAGEELLHALLRGALLRPDGGREGDYRLTERFHEFARARVVAPLQRARAKQLLDHACKLAARINAEWTWNPFAIDMIAVSGGYMTRSSKLAELTLWIVVRPRAQAQVRRFGRSMMTRGDGSAEIGAALRALSSFVRVHMVNDKASIKRPFSVPFRDHDEMTATPPPTTRLRTWSRSLRRRLMGG